MEQINLTLLTLRFLAPVQFLRESAQLFRFVPLLRENASCWVGGGGQRGGGCTPGLRSGGGKAARLLPGGPRGSRPSRPPLSCAFPWPARLVDGPPARSYD